MFSILVAAGWPVYPLLAASIIAIALIVERSITLRQINVLPDGMLQRVIADYRQKGFDEVAIANLEAQAPLGRVLAAGLRNVGNSREATRSAIEEAGIVVLNDLERYLTTLGTIASISPLMGLFGTIIGMIKIFGAQGAAGANPALMAQGISIALYTTGFGIGIAIPAVIFWRHFKASVNSFMVQMQQQAIHLVDVLEGSRKT